MKTLHIVSKRQLQIKTTNNARAGLSVAFSYLLFVFRYVSTFEMELVFVLFWVGLPFFVAVSTIPTLIYLDKVRGRTAAYVRGIAEKMGIGLEMSDSSG